jgi:hypothetical protein
VVVIGHIELVIVTKRKTLGVSKLVIQLLILVVHIIPMVIECTRLMVIRRIIPKVIKRTSTIPKVIRRIRPMVIQQLALIGHTHTTPKVIIRTIPKAITHTEPMVIARTKLKVIIRIQLVIKLLVEVSGLFVSQQLGIPLSLKLSLMLHTLRICPKILVVRTRSDIQLHNSR